MSLLLRLIPAWVPAAILLVAAIAGQVLLMQRNAARTDAAMARQVLAQERAAAAEGARLAAEQYRALESRWHDAQRQAQEAHDAEIARARAAADRAAADVQRLRNALSIAAASLRRATADDPLTAGERETAATGLDLLGRCAERYRQLAFDADTARAAGQQCERAYDALTAR